MNSLYTLALRQSSSLSSDIQHLASLAQSDQLPASSAPIHHQIAAGLEQLDRTVRDYDAMAQREIVTQIRDKALARVDRFKREYAHLDQEYKRLKVRSAPHPPTAGPLTLLSRRHPPQTGPNCSRRRHRPRQYPTTPPPPPRPRRRPSRGLPPRHSYSPPAPARPRLRSLATPPTRLGSLPLPPTPPRLPRRLSLNHHRHSKRTEGTATTRGPTPRSGNTTFSDRPARPSTPTWHRGRPSSATWPTSGTSSRVSPPWSHSFRIGSLPESRPG